MTAIPTLPELVAAVEAQVASADAGEQLATAARMAGDLGDLADRLLGHFVEQARAAGCSWSQIGSALGVTKQAAQQKHSARGDGLVSRFTARARNVLEAARRAAHDGQADLIDAEHVLVGLVDDLDNLATKVLASLGVDPAAVRAAVQRRATPGSGIVQEFIPMAIRTKTALEAALRESLDLGHNYIGTEHILLGLFHLDGGIAREVLDELEVHPEQVRNQVVLYLKGFAQGARKSAGAAG